MKPFRRLREKLAKTKYGRLFLEEYDFKTTVFALLSLAVNVGFAVMNGVSAVMYSSLWFGAFAAYYLMLVLFRGGVIFSDRLAKGRYAERETAYLRAQQKIRLGSGAFLVIVGIAMCTAVGVSVVLGRPTRSGQIMAIATAAYTFYNITMAIVNLVRARRHGNPVVQSLRNLNFANACMSMVSLTVILLDTFSEGEEESFLLTMKSCVGFAACAVVLAIAAYMIVTSVNCLKGGISDEGRRE